MVDCDVVLVFEVLLGVVLLCCVVVGEVEELCEVVVSRVVETWVEVGEVVLEVLLVAEVVEAEEDVADAVTYW